MTEQERSEPDMQKIRTELAESAQAARKKIADAAQSYHDAMDDLTQQLVRLKKRG